MQMNARITLKYSLPHTTGASSTNVVGIVRAEKVWSLHRYSGSFSEPVLYMLPVTLEWSWWHSGGAAKAGC